ncbi:Venom allergen 5 [Amphibalanus amphitrite]|uniref:Venom allergen 5 n=1 Tax=Amphibalanus amphitrite TaxID=1232801 RepID=A0A6A4VWI2_AMPAM|nr:Venom allergen 5 [Amphibalanus amphitrite]
MAGRTPCASYGPGGRNGCSESQLSARDQNVILRAHNQRRREIKNGKYSSRGLPAAAEMPDLRWDPELAKIAQRWANQWGSGAYSGDILTVLPYLKEPREGEILHSNEGDMLPHAQVTRRGEARVRDGEGEVRRSEQGRIVRDGDRVSASASASASAKQHRRQQPDGGARPSYSTTTRRPTRNTRRTRQPSSYRQTTTRRPQRTTTYRRPTTRRPEQQRPDDTNRPQQRPDDRYKTDQKPDDGYKSGERVYRPDGRQEGDVRRSGQWRVIRGRPVVLHQAQDGAGQQRQIIIGPSGRRHVVEDVRVQRQRVEQVSPSDDIVRQLSPILDHIPQGEGIKRKIFSNSTQFSQGVNRVIQTITVS